MDVAMRMADTRIYRSMYICLERKRSGRYMHLRIHVNMWHAMAVYGYMTITCNAAISACGKGREWPRALDVLGVMARSSIQIDTITCNAAVSACEKGGERARALDMLGNMERSSIAMDMITCNAAVGACGEGGMLPLSPYPSIPLPPFPLSPC